MKKSPAHYLLITTYYLLGLTPLVRAGPTDGLRQLTEGLRETIYVLIYFIRDTLFDLESFDYYFTAKLMLFIIILLVVYTVISKNTIFGGDRKNTPVQWIIASAVSILAIRFLPDEFVEMILIQYSTLGIAITVFLPLIIFFFFIQQSGMGPFARKAGWYIYGATFIVMWYQKNENLTEAVNFIYWIGIVFILVSLIFDKRIHKYFGLSGARKLMKMSKIKRYKHWKRELYELEDDYRTGIIDKTQYDKERPIIVANINESAP